MRHAQPTPLHRRIGALRRPVAALAVLAALAAAAGAAAGGRREARDVGLDVVQVARQQVGDAYQWGGNGPDAWDCSGLTSRIWRDVGGVTGMPRVSGDQQRWTVPIPREQLLPGDLVFFGDPVSHVGIYAGDGVMVDASSARNGVLERPLYPAPVIRYGRVPRENMPPVAPWGAAPAGSAGASPAPSPAAAATPAATATLAVSPRPPASPGPAARPRRAPAAAPTPTPAAPRSAAPAALGGPLRGLPQPNLGPSSPLADRAAGNAQTVTGSPRWTDVALVGVAWRHSGGPALPATRSGIEAAGVPVPLDQVRRGDLVVYGQPASHLGLYLGWGYMVDASPTLRRVVVRRVLSSPTVRFVRLPTVRR